MNAPIISIERIGSIPIILQTLKKSGFIELVNEAYPAHKNWEGLPIGETVAIWICYMLTQHDHRMSKVESWIRPRGRILRVFFGRPISSKCFADDRLARILDKFSISEAWNRFEIRFNESFMRVYGIDMDRIRIDMTTANSGGIVTENGILQFGNSKDDPSRPQVKIALATLDPLGIPLTVKVVPGNSADDPLYVPVMKQIFLSTAKRGILFLGDCKMGSMLTRWFVAKNGSFYVCPLSEVSHSTDTILDAIRRFSEGDNSFTPVFREYENGEITTIAEGFEEKISRTAEFEGEMVSWSERLVYAKSFAHAEKELTKLDLNIERAREQIARMNIRKQGKKVYQNFTEVQKKVDTVLKKYSVQKVLSVTIDETLLLKEKGKYGNKPSRIIEVPQFQITSHIDETEYIKEKELCGWRVYTTNKAVEDFSFEQVVLSYRDQFIIEHEFHRLKGVCLSLTPIYIQKDNRIDGLVKLLTLALRILGMIEIPIHDSIRKRGNALDGLFEYNPKKSLHKPKAERILECFEGIHLSTIEIVDQIFHTITDLSPKHREILELMNIEIDAYEIFGRIQ